MKLATVSIVLALGCGGAKDAEPAGSALPASASDKQPTAPPPPAEPSKPKFGGELVEVYKHCIGLVNADRLDDFQAACVWAGYQGFIEKGTVNAAGWIAHVKALRMGMPRLRLEPRIIVANMRRVFAVLVATDMQSPEVSWLWFDAVEFENSNRIRREAWYRASRPLNRAAVNEVPTVTAIAMRSAAENANAELVQAMNVAFNKHDAAAIYAHASTDVVESDLTHDQDVTGAKLLQRGAEELFTLYPDAKRTPCATKDAMCWTGYNGSSRLSDLVAAGEFVVSLGVFEGTHDKRVLHSYAELFRVENGAVKRIWRFATTEKPKTIGP